MTDRVVVPELPKIFFPSKRFIVLNVAVVCLACGVSYLAPQITLAATSVAVLFILSCWRMVVPLAVMINGGILLGIFWEGIQVEHSYGLILFVCVLSGLAFHWARFGLSFRRSRIALISLLLFAMLLLYLLHSPERELGFAKAATYFRYNLALFSVMLLSKRLRDLRLLLVIVVALGTFVSLLSYIDVILGGSEGVVRYSFRHINVIAFARSVGITIILLVALSRGVGNPIFGLLKWLVAALLIIMLFLAGSRGPILAVVVTISSYLILFQSDRKRWLGLALFLATCLFLVAVVGMLGAEETAERITGTSERTAGLTVFYRLTAWATAVQLTLQHPILGVGTSGFAAHHFIVYPHNIFLEIACELGIPGLLLFFSLLIAGFRKACSLYRQVRDDPFRSKLLISFILIGIYALVNAQVSGSITGNAWLWLALGGIMAIDINLKTGEESRDSCLLPDKRN